ncbi:MAG: CapA family protein [Deltaproteobacteria bacterium]|nr:CapA family protein [Candidatus Deferrimicrobiaceae bacterium]
MSRVASRDKPASDAIIHDSMSGKTMVSILPLLLTLVLCPCARSSGTLTVAAVGDIMMGTTWPEEVLPPQDGAGIFDAVTESFQGAEIVFGNLEGPLLDGGEGIKCARNRDPRKSLCYEFRMPARYAGRLESAGFNTMNIANNHTFDFGREGIESTVGALDNAGIQAVGGDNVASFCTGGKSVAVVGFSYSPPSPNSYPLQDVPAAMEIVKELKEEFDLVLVSFHGGAEGKDASQVRDADEIFAGTNRGNVVYFARAVIDAGADLVIGHGPHVLRAMEVYKGKLIAYSLGNFLTYGMFNIKGASGISLVLRADIDLETGNFTGGSIVPVTLRDGGIPYPDPDRTAIGLVRKLIGARGIPAGLIVEEDGALTPAPPSLPSQEPVPSPREDDKRGDQISPAGSFRSSLLAPMNRLR